MEVSLFSMTEDDFKIDNEKPYIQSAFTCIYEYSNDICQFALDLIEVRSAPLYLKTIIFLYFVMCISDLLGDIGTIFILLNFFFVYMFLSNQMPPTLNILKDFFIQRIQLNFYKIYALIPRANPEN